MRLFGFEIICRRIPKEKKEIRTRKHGYAAKHWTKDEEIELADMYSRGLLRKTMASRLNRTEAAVYARLKKLGLV